MKKQLLRRTGTLLQRFLQRIFPLALMISVSGSFAFANDYIPGKTQTAPVLLKGGDLYTVSHGVLKNTDLLFEKGRISAIAPGITPPPSAVVIDVTGQRVYPGIIAPVTSLGLLEIGAARATNDQDEVGSVNPEVQARVAYNPDSEVSPTVRANGVTSAQVAPQGDLIAGRSDLMNLDGWNREDATEKANVGMHIAWPGVSIVTAWWMDLSAEDQKKRNDENRTRLYSTFDEAKSYWQAKSAGKVSKIDLRWEAMIPVFTKELPVFVDANDYRQIEQAIEFSQKYAVRMILVGAEESWRCVELLTKHDIPVITAKVQSLPFRTDDDYDRGYRLPKVLADAGVRFCISNGPGQNWQVRNLPFQAGQAVAYGLTQEQALRAITLSPAEIMGVGKDLGSLDVGKKATIVVSRGDIMDQITNDVTYEFIEGRPVDLNSRHTELYRKFSQKGVK